MVGSQAPEGIGERGLDRRWTCVVAQPAAVGGALGAELDADQHVVVHPARERLGDQQLVVAHAVEVAGVEQIDPGVEGGVDRRDALAAVARPVHPRHPHAAEAERRNLRADRSEPALLHQRATVGRG